VINISNKDPYVLCGDGGEGREEHRRIESGRRQMKGQEGGVLRRPESLNINLLILLKTRI